jgi:16S rRNA processing protein RimM
MSNQFNKDSFLHIATIGKAVGLKGDMKIHIKSDFPEQFVKGSSFFINKKDTITLSDINHERGTIRIQGCENPESTKKFTNANLYTTLEDTKQNCHLENGQFFWFDIIGCKVVENSVVLGVVSEVERIAISDYLNIKTSEKLTSEGFSKSFLIPYHKPFILKTNIEDKIIEVTGGMDILEAS